MSKQHVFQPGDRVVHGLFQSKGTYVKPISDMHAMLRDDGKEGHTEPPYWVTLELHHDSSFQVGDWVRVVEDEICAWHRPHTLNGNIKAGHLFKIHQLTFRNAHGKPNDNGEHEIVYIENLVKIDKAWLDQQHSSKETLLDKKKLTPEEQWIQQYYPIPASEMKGKSDLECLDHAIQKWRGFRPDALKEYGLEERPVNKGDSTCSLCVNHYDKVASTGNCPTCPLAIYGKGSCIDSPRGEIPYNQGVEAMITELVQVKRKLMEEEKKPEKCQFYVNGHGPYEDLHVTEATSGYNILRVSSNGVSIAGCIRKSTNFQRENDHIKVHIQ